MVTGPIVCKKHNHLALAIPCQACIDESKTTPCANCERLEGELGNMGKLANKNYYSAHYNGEESSRLFAENEKLKKALKLIEVNFINITRCDEPHCEGCYQDAKMAAELAKEALEKIGKE